MVVQSDARKVVHMRFERNYAGSAGVKVRVKVLGRQQCASCRFKCTKNTFTATNCATLTIWLF